MGDEVLKTINILIISTIVSSALFAQDSSIKEETAIYDTLFDAINKKRFGLDASNFTHIKDPFFIPSKAKVDSNDDSNVTKEATYTLYAIMENQAKINDQWIKKGAMINDLRLVKLTNESVILANAERTLILPLSQKGTHNVVITSN